MVKNLLKSISLISIALFLLVGIGNAFTWTIETVDTNAGRGGSIGLTVDRTTSVHIAYYDQNNGDLRYATDTPSGVGAWTLEAPDTTGITGQFPKIGVDDSQQPYIAYYDKTAHALQYAVQTSGAWTIVSVDTIGNAGEYLGFAFSTTTSSHNFGIAYHERNSRGLRFACSTAGDLESQLANASGYVIDTTNTPSGIQAAIVKSAGISYANATWHIIYRVGYTTGKLYYATGTAGQGDWNPTIIDESGNTGLYPAIAISGSTIHTAYFSQGSKSLMYAAKTVGEATWTIQTVKADIGRNGGYCSLSILTGAPAIGYYDSNSTAAVLAIPSAGSYTSYTWASQIINNSQDVGRYISIAVDVANKVHAAFFDMDSRKLLYSKGN